MSHYMHDGLQGDTGSQAGEDDETGVETADVRSEHTSHESDVDRGNSARPEGEQRTERAQTQHERHDHVSRAPELI